MYYASDKMETLKEKRERQRLAVERRLAMASKSNGKTTRKKTPDPLSPDEELVKRRKDVGYLGGLA